MADDDLMVLPASAFLTPAEKRANAIAAERAAATEAAEQAKAEALTKEQAGIRLPSWHPHCPRCNGPVERLEFTCDPGSHHVRVSVVCHGAPSRPIQWGSPRGAGA